MQVSWVLSGTGPWPLPQQLSGRNRQGGAAVVAPHETLMPAIALPSPGILSQSPSPRAQVLSVGRPHAPDTEGKPSWTDPSDLCPIPRPQQQQAPTGDFGEAGACSTTWFPPQGFPPGLSGHGQHWRTDTFRRNRVPNSPAHLPTVTSQGQANGATLIQSSPVPGRRRATAGGCAGRGWSWVRGHRGIRPRGISLPFSHQPNP